MLTQKILYFIFLLSIILFPCHSFGYQDYEQNLKNFEEWESSELHLNSANELWFTTKYYKPQPPDLFSFVVHTQIQHCDSVEFSIFIFGTIIITFTENNLLGYITIDGTKIKIVYDVSSDNSGMYLINITGFQNHYNLLEMMIKGKTMILDIPFMMYKRNINLKGFTKALDRSTGMCVKAMYTR